MELILDGIQKKFGEKEVLRGVSFPFEQGKIYGLLGRNGAGKTTLFNCLSNEISMDAGTAQLKDVFRHVAGAHTGGYRLCFFHADSAGFF